MKYKGKELLLDNFRGILGNYSVDIQDIVRSAILDGVDIEPYLGMCKSNPFKLDQIRLSIKEKQTFDYANLSGDIICQIREFIRTRTFDIVEFNKQISHSLSDEHISFLLKWLGSGINLKGLDISVIPKSLLEVFDTGLSLGVDMKKYNTGAVYNPKLLADLIKVEQNGHPVDKFLVDGWDSNVISTFALHSSNHLGTWTTVYNSVTPQDSLNRVMNLLYLSFTTSSEILLRLQSVTEKGNRLYSDECVEVVHRVQSSRELQQKVDMNKLLAEITPKAMEEVIEVSKLESSRTISGKFNKTSRIVRKEGLSN